MYCTEKLFFSLFVLQIGMWFCFFPPPFSASHLLEPSLSLPCTVNPGQYIVHFIPVHSCVNDNLPGVVHTASH